MSLSPGFLYLGNIHNAAQIAKSVIMTRIPIPEMGSVAYTIRGGDSVPCEAGDTDVPIFVKQEVPSSGVAAMAEDYAVLEFDTVTSTHSILEQLVKHPSFESTDLLVTCNQQIHGRGRRGERVWSSPPGCAMFSFSQRITMHSLIAQHIGFLQHIASLAIVQSVPQIPELRIKWPNDVYYKKNKVAGLVVNCQMSAKEIVALIGVGVNVDNQEPSDCLNRILSENCVPEKSIEIDRLISDVVRNFNHSISTLKSEEDFQLLKSCYTKRWMHSGQEILHKGQMLIIRDVDEQGFLIASPKDGGPDVSIGFDFDDVSLPVT